MNTFLTAQWKNLIMANYEVSHEILLPYLPAHTELDTWKGRLYVSLVGFMFLETRVLGLKIPFHVNFEEVNLRFYVKYQDGDQLKRGVVFIKEIVPKLAIASVANSLYGEKYATMPMKNELKQEGRKLTVRYLWKYKNKWNHLGISAENSLIEIAEGSEAEFITEHYWGYTKHKNSTSEYQVAHPRWEQFPVQSYEIDCDFGAIYGNAFAFLSSQKPTSVLIANGSEIEVKKGKKI